MVTEINKEKLKNVTRKHNCMYVPTMCASKRVRMKSDQLFVYRGIDRYCIVPQTGPKISEPFPRHTLYLKKKYFSSSFRNSSPVTRPHIAGFFLQGLEFISRAIRGEGALRQMIFRLVKYQYYIFSMNVLKWCLPRKGWLALLALLSSCGTKGSTPQCINKMDAFSLP